MNENNTPRWSQGKGGAAITVRLGPNAREDQIEDILDDGTLYVRLVKAGGEPDRELVRFLAKVLKVKVGQIEVVAGQGRQDKLIAIEDLAPDVVEQRIFSFRQAK